MGMLKRDAGSYKSAGLLDVSTDLQQSAKIYNNKLIQLHLQK